MPVLDCTPTTPEGLDAALTLFWQRNRDNLIDPTRDHLDTLFAQVKAFVLGRPWAGQPPMVGRPYNGDLRLEDAATEWKVAIDALNGMPDGDFLRDEALTKRSHEAEDRLPTIAARSLDGLQAKARVLKALRGHEESHDDVEALAHSLAEDLLGIRAAAGQTLAPVAAEAQIVTRAAA